MGEVTPTVTIVFYQQLSDLGEEVQPERTGHAVLSDLRRFVKILETNRRKCNGAE